MADQQQEDMVIFHHDTDSYTIFYKWYDEFGSSGLKSFLFSEGFADAEVLHENWFVKDLRVYRLEDNYLNNLRTYGYCTIEFVGFPYHVIPKSEQTPEQYWFIKRLFDD
jgi:hypothetical protein